MKIITPHNILLILFIRFLFNKMSTWLELLEECGIPMTEDDTSEFVKFITPEKEPEDLRIIKTDKQYEDEWLEEQETNCIVDPKTGFGLNFSDEVYSRQNKKHRYSRPDRFKKILVQLLNLEGRVPEPVIIIIQNDISSYVNSKFKIWNTIRQILKLHGLRRYYNLIPSIIKQVRGEIPFIPDDFSIPKVLDKFLVMSDKFNGQLRDEWSIPYFPNLRFVALKMIESEGITYPYHVPIVRTRRKRLYLEGLYNGLYNNN